MHNRFFLLLILTLFSFSASAQSYSYVMETKDKAEHTYRISLTTQAASSGQTAFQLPAWRPGRYILQDYAAGVMDFSAKDASGKVLEWKKSNNDTWNVYSEGNAQVTVTYRFYANVMDAGSSVLNREQAYFNGANLFMHVRDRYNVPCTLEVKDLWPDSKVATSLQREGEGFVFTAPDYHDLVDAPTIISPTLKTLELARGDVKFFLHFQGRFEGGDDTEAAILENVGKIIDAQSAIFGGFPDDLEAYHFIYQLLPMNMRHAVEHKHSSCYTLPDRTVSSPEAAGGMYGITSHEFFHLWNVKRIRPAALWPYDYQKEAYTTLHWFTEGVTEYYTHLALVRGGVITRDKFLATVARTFERLDNSYANDHISPAQSSFDSWLARSEYGSPHLRTSYYPLGERVGFFLDLELRKVSEGKVTLDHVFRHLYEKYYQQDKGVPEEGIRIACENLTGTSFTTFFDRYVNGTERFPYNTYLKPYGLRLNMEDPESVGWGGIGIRSADRMDFGWYLKMVTPLSDASLGGLSDGDIVLKVNDLPATEFDPEAFFAEAKKGDKIQFTVFSSGAEQTLTVTYTEKDIPRNYSLDYAKKKLKKKEEALLDAWLGEEPGSE